MATTSVGLEPSDLVDRGATQHAADRGGQERAAAPADRRPRSGSGQADALGRPGTFSVHRPSALPSPVPVAERDAHAHQPQIASVEGGGVEQVLLAVCGDHPGHGGLQVGHPEPGPDPETFASRA